MRKEDVLISEYRVTVLADDGQYTFDWVDEDSRTVEFVQSKSDFPDYNDEVTDALAMKGISIHKGNQSMDNQIDSQTLDAPSSKVESELGSGSTSKSDPTEPDPITPIEPDSPDDSSNKEQNKEENKEENDLSSESENPEPIGGGDFSPIEGNGNTTPNQKDQSEPRQEGTKSKEETHGSTTDSSKDYEEISFIVRMSDPSEREQAIKSISGSDFEGSVDMLRLTGPFKVTYRIKDDSVKLVGVEDMGIGSEVEDL